jgi:hypothetical protein
MEGYLPLIPSLAYEVGRWAFLNLDSQLVSDASKIRVTMQGWDDHTLTPYMSLIDDYNPVSIPGLFLENNLMSKTDADDNNDEAID